MKVPVASGSGRGVDLDLTASEKLGKKRFAYPSSSLGLPAGGEGTIKLKPPKKLVKKLGKALKRKAKVKRRIQIEAREGATGLSVSRELKLVSKGKRKKGKGGASAGRELLRNNESPCPDPWVTNRVTAVTGNTPTGAVCDARHYNDGSWSSEGELGGHVSDVMNGCNSSAGLRNMVQAVIEVTGERPSGAACSMGIYETGHVIDCTSACTTVNWDVYKDEEADSGPVGAEAGTGKVSAWRAVHQTMQICSRPEVALAILIEAGSLPDRKLSAGWPNQIASGTQNKGQCHAQMYRQGVYSSFASLRRQVEARVDSTTTCADSLISDAYVELTGWKPVASSSTTGECNVDRYGGYGGSWSSYAELKNRIAASFRCLDPWINQIYLFDLGTFARGQQLSGACNPHLYGNGVWASYAELKANVAQTRSALAAQGIEFNSVSSAKLTPPGGGPVQTIDFNQILLQTGNNLISTGGGNLIATGGLNLIATGGLNLVNVAGGSKLGIGASLISDKGAGIIGQAGGTLISTGGGNIAAGVG